MSVKSRQIFSANISVLCFDVNKLHLVEISLSFKKVQLHLEDQYGFL